MKILGGLSLLFLLGGKGLAFAPGRSSPKHLLSTSLQAQQTPEIVKDVASALISIFDPINAKLSSGYHESLSGAINQLKSTLSQLQSALDSVDAPVLLAFEKARVILVAALQSYLADHPSFQPLYNSISQHLSSVSLDGASPSLVILASTLVTYAAVSSLLSAGQSPPPLQPYPLQRYDPFSARAYFDRRPIKVVARGLDVATTSIGFGLGLLQDYLNKSLDQKSEERAVQLAGVLTKLGPTFIKVGQSLSIRTDLLSPAYVRGLQTLQDQVPAFDTAIAKQILETEWGDKVDNVVVSVSAKPVAAASLGQVYKATLKSTGEQVAIKVQRPNIMEQIALDMHLLREMGSIAKRVFNLNTDTVGTVDAWGTGFVDELDYHSEAKNAQTFMKSIQTTPLKDVVFAPDIIEQYSTRRVLTTAWVDGERLDKSAQDDVTVLCSIAMNTYLTMMLETGLLHCDPHPGNLLRTPEGRLCILDWGMVTTLDKDLQLTLIEHMAHLTSADYAEIPRDLLLLGFIPPNKADLIEDSGVVEVLADIYGAWTTGGGVGAINVNQVVTQLQDLTATRGNLFQIPPYFAYIAKSFSVLEGIGLSNDPKYSIINECLPYVSKRLLTDKSERTGGALSTFIFGPEKYNVDTRIVDYRRVEQLVTGFGNYTTSASGALLGKENMSRTQQLEQAADQLLDLIFTEEETPLQSILLEQLAKIVASTSRSVWTQLREQSGMLPSGRTILGTLVDPLGLWRTSPLVRMSAADDVIVDTTTKLIAFSRQQSIVSTFDLSTIDRQEAVELASILTSKVWRRRSALMKTSNRFITQLLKLTADRLAKGDRSGITVPEPTENVGNSVSNTHNDVAAIATDDSLRLQDARRRLKSLSDDESREDIVALTMIRNDDP